jgi:hypothetical protein
MKPEQENQMSNASKGRVKSLTPQKEVTRAEAAVCVWKIKDKTAGTGGG